MTFLAITPLALSAAVADFEGLPRLSAKNKIDELGIPNSDE